jgi:methylenetetrahydrofolate dehydrogenase (NADP+)/methenyltetrahydrofolate cyclohydrolase
MTAEIIDGDKIAHDLKAIVRQELDSLRSADVDSLDHGLACGLAVVQVGDDYSSTVYWQRLARLGDELEVPCRRVHLPRSASEANLLAEVAALNADPTVTGILLLRPFPPQISESAVFRGLDPLKDIEAVHPENAGLVALGTPRYLPSTAASTFHVLDEWLANSGIDATNFYRNSLIVVVGRSNNVGKPAVSMAYSRQAAVESIDEWASRSGQLGWHTRRADVLIVAAGVPGLIRAEHVNEHAVVLDVGINPLTDPATGAVQIVGDVAFSEVMDRARALTPVPGGIGPVTDVWLLRNAILASRNAILASRNAILASRNAVLSTANGTGRIQPQDRP